jgi:hypothetical protein
MKHTLSYFNQDTGKVDLKSLRAVGPAPVDPAAFPAWWVAYSTQLSAVEDFITRAAAEMPDVRPGDDGWEPEPYEDFEPVDDSDDDLAEGMKGVKIAAATAEGADDDEDDEEDN